MFNDFIFSFFNFLQIYFSKLEASCTNVRHEWSAKHSTLVNFLGNSSFFMFLQIFFFYFSKNFEHPSHCSRRGIADFNQRESPVRYFEQFRQFWNYNKFSQNLFKRKLFSYDSISGQFLWSAWLYIVFYVEWVFRFFESVYGSDECFESKNR